MEEASQSHYSCTSPCSTAPPSTEWFSAFSLAPWSLYRTPLDQEVVFGSASSAEGSCSTEVPHLAPHHHCLNSFDLTYSFGPHTYSSPQTPATGIEAYQVSTSSAVGSSFLGPWDLSLDHPATMREEEVRNGLVESENRSYEIVPQDIYRKGRRTAHAIPLIQYHGYSLNHAYKRDYRELTDAATPAWSHDISVGAKLAIVFCFPGKPQYHRQVHVLRAGSTALTRSKLANIISQEIQTYLGKLQASNCDPIKHCGVDIALENLVLIDVRHVSKGSLQPTIGVVTKYN